MQRFIASLGDTLFIDSSSGMTFYLSAFDKYDNLIGYYVCTWRGFSINDSITKSSQVYIRPPFDHGGWLYAEADSIIRDSIYIQIKDNLPVLPVHKKRIYNNTSYAVYNLLGRTFKDHKTVSLSVWERRSRLMFFR